VKKSRVSGARYNLPRNYGTSGLKSNDLLHRGSNHKFASMQKNPLHAASVILLLLATGCADSTVTSDAGRTSDDRTLNATRTPQPTGHERAVVSLTDAAVAKFKEFLAAHPTKHIRLAVINGGSTGYTYDLQVDDSIREYDFVDRSSGITIVVDPKNSVFVDGSKIDWRMEPDGRTGFTFDNPNAIRQ